MAQAFGGVGKAMLSTLCVCVGVVQCIYEWIQACILTHTHQHTYRLRRSSQQHAAHFIPDHGLAHAPYGFVCTHTQIYQHARVIS
jgi:sucrose-6-phosphate hydrolase SacC (GH32 family)